MILEWFGFSNWYGGCTVTNILMPTVTLKKKDKTKNKKPKQNIKTNKTKQLIAINHSSHFMIYNRATLRTDVAIGGG